MYYPWTREYTFYKSTRVEVRPRIGLSTYSDATRSWGQTIWHPASAVHAASGYQPGYCAI